jgi:uncharacterized protein (DUF488 family)
LLVAILATLFTIGHSTRTVEELIALLQAQGIRSLVDVRSYPMSRHLPWFQGPQYPPFLTPQEAERHEALEITLPRRGITYLWMRALGGRRRKIRNDSPHTALQASSFRNYADYMLTPEFHAAIEDLVRLADIAPTCIMCAEAQVYWHCHRMLISDFLVAHGHAVLHIEGANKAKPHRMTPEARVVNGEILYDGGCLKF